MRPLDDPDDRIGGIFTHLSSPRLEPYLAVAQGDPRDALRLYQ